MYMLFDTAFTIVGCPYDALTPELTLDHDERTSLITYRMFVSIIAGVLAAFLFDILVFSRFDSPQTQFLVIGVACGITFVPTILVTFFGTRERTDFEPVHKTGLRDSLGYLIRNREWRYAAVLRVLSWLPVDIASVVFAYLLVYWIGMSEGDSSVTQGIILLSAALFLPLVLWMSNRLEKKTAYIISAATWVFFMLGILLIPQGATIPVYIVAVGVGLGVSSAHVLPSAMSPDVVDVDELMSGERQEGIYSGINVFVRKLSTTLVIFLVGWTLEWSGYVPNAEVQTPEALTAIRLIISVVPALVLLASIVVAWRYPLTRGRHAEIRAELQRRRFPTA
jgi:Na+/melibiose symporter-like transporter